MGHPIRACIAGCLKGLARVKGHRRRCHTGKLAELVKEGGESRALDHKHAVRIEAAAAADDVRGGSGRQHGRTSRREAAQQRPV